MYSYCNMTNDINLTNKKHSNKISFLEEDLIILDKLNRYMLHNEFVIKNINNTENIDKYNKTEKKVLSNVNVIKHDKKQENYFVIKDKSKDLLFWFFYKVYSLEYNKNNFFDNSNFLIEKNFKIDSIEKLKQSNLLRKYKLSKSFIENDLLNEKKISLSTFKVLCEYYELNICYVKNRTYHLISNYDLDDDNNNDNNDNNDNKDIKENYIVDDRNFYIMYNNDDEFKLSENVEFNKKELINIKNKYIEIDNIIKPLKSVSAYKLKELQEMSVKLNINIEESGKKKTKQILYNGIQIIINNIKN